MEMPFGPESVAVLGGAAVAGETRFARAGGVMDRARFQIEAVDGVPLAQGEPEVAGGVEIERARAIQRCAGNGGPVGGRLFFAGAGEGGDDPGAHRHFADAVIQDVAGVDVARAVDPDGVRLLELRFHGGAVIAGKALDPGAGDGGNDPSPHRYAPHGVAGSLHHKKIAGRVETYLVGLVHFRLQGGAAITRVAARAAARHRRDAPIGSDLADAVIVRVAEVERAVRAAHESEGIVYLCAGGRSAIAAETFRAIAGNGTDFGGWGGPNGHHGGQQREQGGSFHTSRVP